MCRIRLVALTLTLTLAAAIVAFPPASAADYSSTLPLPAVSDSDGDGWYEVEWDFSTPQCGCACPVVGAGVELIGLGQEPSEAWVATSGCQTAWSVDYDGGEPDATEPPVAQPFLICWSPGGLFTCTMA